MVKQQSKIYLPYIIVSDAQNIYFGLSVTMNHIGNKLFLNRIVFKYWLIGTDGEQQIENNN